MLEEDEFLLTKIEMDAVQKATDGSKFLSSPENNFEMQIWQDKPASSGSQTILNKDIVLGNINDVELRRAESYAYMCKLAEQQGWVKTYNFYYFKLYLLLNISNSVGGFARKIRQSHFHSIDRNLRQKPPQEQKSALDGIVKNMFKKKSLW